ncbi:MAG: hypothetical protein WCV73_04975 [Patescibacteria group bacterium]|jgi:hypothetical protein
MRIVLCIAVCVICGLIGYWVHPDVDDQLIRQQTAMSALVNGDSAAINMFLPGADRDRLQFLLSVRQLQSVTVSNTQEGQDFEGFESQWMTYDIPGGQVIRFTRNNGTKEEYAFMLVDGVWSWRFATVKCYDGNWETSIGFNNYFDARPLALQAAKRIKQLTSK